MEKPTFKKICFMYLQQLTNFPYIEKDFDAITDYELLCKVVEYLNKVIANENLQNESILALYDAFNELKDYVDNLDFQEEVNNKLDEMAQDGTLTSLLEQIVTENQLPSLNIHRIGRKIFQSGFNDSTYDTSQSYYATAQASCLINDDVIACLFSPTDEEHSNSNNLMLRIYNINTGTLIREHLLEDCGHGNGMCYYNGKLYITDCFHKNGSTYIYNSDVHIIDFATGLYEDTITIDGLDLTNNILLNFDYDKKTQKFYAMQRGIVHELDENFGIVNSINLNISPIVNIGTYQIIKAYNNKFYMVNAYPNYICVFNNLGNKTQYYKLSEWADNSFNIGEVEAIDFNSIDDIIMTSGRPLAEGASKYIFQILKCNTDNNVSVIDPWRQYQIHEKQIIVSNVETYNPIGITSAPFNDINEAVDYALSPNGKNSNSIKLVQGTYDFGMLYNLKNQFRLIGSNSIVNGLGIYNSNVVIESLQIKSTHTGTTAPYPITIKYSDVLLSGITFDIDYTAYSQVIDLAYSSIKLFNTSQPANIGTNTFINIGAMCQINGYDSITNLKTAGNYTNLYGIYNLTDDVEVSSGTIPKNSFLTANSLNINSYCYPFKYINIEYTDGSETKKLAKFKHQRGKYYNMEINSMDVVSNTPYINICTVRYYYVTDPYIGISSNTTYNMSGTAQSSPHITINKIFLSNT